ncbi:MAG: hypothetical protein JXB47_15180 [Anaerolineae bacterium]|nr:hypothetical protein [Anaerolineae bacterium]
MDLDNNEKKDALQSTIEEIDRNLRRAYSTQTTVEEYTDIFTRQLFEGLESFIDELIALGVPGVQKARRLKVPTGREALQLQLTGYKILFVRLAEVAWPNLRDEARIPGVKFKEECGRIAVFLSENPDRESFYDFLIWADGSWFAWGYGWPKQDSELNQTNFRALAAELIQSFVKDIHRTWKVRDETTLGDATSPNIARRCYNYGLPGDE